MDTNKVADLINTFLATKHTRVYRNKAPQSPVFPYVIFDCESVDDAFPSSDYTVYVDVYDAPNVSVRAMNTLADTIDSSFTGLLINDSALNLHIQSKIIRQYVPIKELVSSQMINMQFSARVYFK